MQDILTLIPVFGYLVALTALVLGFLWTASKGKNGHGALQCFLGVHDYLSNNFVNTRTGQVYHLCRCCGKKQKTELFANKA